MQEILANVADIIEGTAFDADSLESAFRQRAEQIGVKAGNLIHPARLALTGRTSTPGLLKSWNYWDKALAVNAYKLPNGLWLHYNLENKNIPYL